jgi:division protein CdvB (Snf7/Vps24/ESCRT-III family)
VSQRVWTIELEEINLGTMEEPHNVLVAKELDTDFKEQLTNVLDEYKDVFAWSYEDMNGLNPEFYHHKINLAKDAIPVQQRTYRLKPNYAAKVKEEIDKLLRSALSGHSKEQHG